MNQANDPWEQSKIEGSKFVQNSKKENKITSNLSSLVDV